MRNRKRWSYLPGGIIGWLALVCLLLAGCGGEQTVYTESEIIQYVKDVYGEVYRLTDTDHTVLPDGTVRDDYIFAEEDGVSFMVSTSSRISHNRFGFVTSGSPVLSDGYLDAVIGCRQQDLQRLFQDSDLDARLVRTGGGNYDCGAAWNLSIYLEDADRFNDAAKLIEKIDKILQFRCNRTYARIGSGAEMTRRVHVYLKPDRAADDTWKEADNIRDYRIAEIGLSTDSRQRLTAEDAAAQLEKGYVMAAKWNRQAVYRISDELWDRYPAPWLDVVMIGTHAVEPGTYRFYYDEDSETYWLACLDPCQDFDGFPYPYEPRGRFADLVSMMNGVYTAADWAARWKIGEDIWEARLLVSDRQGVKYAYEDFYMEFNGVRKILTRPPEGKTNGTVSGRWFSIEDLIRMLHVQVIMNQDTMTAVIY